MGTPDYSGQAFVYRFAWLVAPIRDAPVLPLEVRSVLQMNANEESTPSGTWRTCSWSLPCQPVVVETPPQVQRHGAMALLGGSVRGSAHGRTAVRLEGGVNQPAHQARIFPISTACALTLVAGSHQRLPLVMYMWSAGISAGR